MKPSLFSRCGMGFALGCAALAGSMAAYGQEQEDVAQNAVAAVSMRVVEGDKQRYVHAPRATVRCGPGTSYYPTGLLEQGTAVDVYVQTEDGWSGIRPPEGSHNWVSAEFLYLMPGGRVAEVSEDKAPAWVGSANDQVSKLLYQTELSVSQSVSILDEAYRTEGGAKKLWFKIAPPQGEFRWVRSSMLGADPISVPKSTAEKTATEKKKSRAASALANKGQSGDEASQGVAKASYQSPVSKKPSKDAQSEGNLAWSDEAEQVARVEREIRREQAASEQKILESAPSGAKKGSLIKRSPAGSSEMPVERQVERSTERSVDRPVDRPVDRSGDREVVSGSGVQVLRPRPRPTKPQSYEDRDWQLFQERSVGPRETDSMNHVLGMFGMSLVDPNQIPGHPKQSAGGASGPRDGAIYSQSSPIRSVPRSAIASRPTRPSGPMAGGSAIGSNAVGSNAMGSGNSYAGIDHLPRPTGRYSSPRLAGGYPQSGERPWWKTQGPLFGSDADVGNGALDYGTLGNGALNNGDLGNSEFGSGLAMGQSRMGFEGDEALGDGAPSRSIGSGSMMLASGPSMRSSASDSGSNGGSNWRSSDEVDRFQTPAIQDALAELSMIVSRPVDQWNLAPLRDSAMQWIERGETPLIRGEARLLLDRIERFELLRQRTGGYVAPAAMGPQIPMTSNASYQVERSPSMQSELSGWLVAVHTSLPGQPEFALTDDVGNVKAYVQSTTGLNLRRYTQQLVTVYGPQGYLPTLGAKQIVADRVVRMRN